MHCSRLLAVRALEFLTRVLPRPACHCCCDAVQLGWQPKPPSPFGSTKKCGVSHQLTSTDHLCFSLLHALSLSPTLPPLAPPLDAVSVSRGAAALTSCPGGCSGGTAPPQCRARRPAARSARRRCPTCTQTPGWWLCVGGADAACEGNAARVRYGLGSSTLA